METAGWVQWQDGSAPDPSAREKRSKGRTTLCNGWRRTPRLLRRHARMRVKWPDDVLETSNVVPPEAKVPDGKVDDDSDLAGGTQHGRGGRPWGAIGRGPCIEGSRRGRLIKEPSSCRHGARPLESSTIASGTTGGGVPDSLGARVPALIAEFAMIVGWSLTTRCWVGIGRSKASRRSSGIGWPETASKRISCK
ncbi:hypothetical protein ZWY2020_040067 [Hordeum vulgare]|nr:hypothetical protein ZWY2020_040067 [Hordeum vulgare]